SPNTAIIFFSDNGGNMYNQVDGVVPTSNAPLRGGKATVYEGGIRVPAVVVWPGITAPDSRSDAVIQSTDLYPTILSLLGLPPTPNQPVDGKDITPALRAQPFDRGPIFTYFPHNPKVPDNLPPSVVVHRGDWKLIRIFFGGENGAHAYRLYNLKEDLGESRDVASRYPELVKELDDLITAFLGETEAVLPLRNPRYHPQAASRGSDTAGPAG
ncbi:MAG: sulfatase-like hydrolase/transferase, partial [Thermogutta sp.]|nr:sulfatase-like hydrolase/transferase [Thermogutta sp.]